MLSQSLSRRGLPAVVGTVCSTPRHGHACRTAGEVGIATAVYGGCGLGDTGCDMSRHAASEGVMCGLSEYRRCVAARACAGWAAILDAVARLSYHVTSTHARPQPNVRRGEVLSCGSRTAGERLTAVGVVLPRVVLEPGVGFVKNGSQDWGRALCAVLCRRLSSRVHVGARRGSTVHDSPRRAGS